MRGLCEIKDTDGNVSTGKKLDVGLHERVAETESVIRLDEKISGRNFGYLVLDIDTQMVKPINLLDYKRPVTCSQPGLRPWGTSRRQFYNPKQW